MKKYILPCSFLLLIMCTSRFSLSAQDSTKTTSQDSVKTVKKEKHFKNTVRFNLTNPIIFGEKSIIFGYERTIGQHQSFSVNVGTFSLPHILGNIDTVNSNVSLTRNSKDVGYSVSADYRFYLSKENKYNSPRGVYIGPYIAYNYFQRENTWALKTDAFEGDVNTTFTLDIKTVGAELGYQFVLWNRVALDFILVGPGISGYSLSTDINTTLEADDQALLFEKINEALADKFPGYSFVIKDEEYKKSGTTNTTSFGFRYIIHLGFRF